MEVDYKWIYNKIRGLNLVEQWGTLYDEPEGLSIGDLIVKLLEIRSKYGDIPVKRDSEDYDMVPIYSVKMFKEIFNPFNLGYYVGLGE